MATKANHVTDALAYGRHLHISFLSTNMVTLYNSQYRKHYKSPHWDDFEVDEYCRKLDYRVGRRSVEHRHEPWCWDSEDDEISEVDQIITASLPVSNEVEQRRSQTGSDHKRKGISNEEKRAAEEAPAVEHRLKQNSNARHRKTRSKKNRATTKTKSKDKQLTAGSTSNVSKNQKEPFVPYGWANEGPMEKKYTYNVKANPKEVYPAALRALKRRELDVRRRLENQKQTAREREIMKEKFVHLGCVSSTCLTEYQRSYCLQNDVKEEYF